MLSSTVGILEDERIASVIDNKNGKSMTNHCANIENIANVVEYIKNMDPK